MDRIGKAISDAVSGKEALAKSEAHIRDYVFHGGADTEAEDIALGERFGVGEMVKAAWANAKQTEREMLEAWTTHAKEWKPSSFFHGAPSVEAVPQSEPKPPAEAPVEEEPKKAAVKPNVVKFVRKNGVLYRRAADGSYRRWLGAEPKPKPKPETVVQLRPMEQAKPEQQEPEPAEEEPGAKNEGTATLPVLLAEPPVPDWDQAIVIHPR